MFLLAGPSPEFLKFIQILCWIILPVLLGTVTFTIIMHYRRKKRNASLDTNNDDEFLDASPEQVGYTNGDGDYILFDHSNLIQEYKQRLSYHHAKYSALRKDYTKLESRFENILNHASFPDGNKPDLNLKKTSMENQLNQTFTDTSLPPTAQQDYLKDMLDEKNAHIEFLQSQLDIRIRQTHFAEQQKAEVLSEKEQLNSQIHELNAEIASLRNDVMIRQDDADKMQVSICRHEEKITTQQELISGKLDHITYLENQLHEIKQQNEVMNAATADANDRVVVLEQQLSDEQSRLSFVEQKLAAQKQAMKRLYKEFSGFMDGDADVPPVISLRPDYISRQNEETVQHQADIS